MPLSYRKRGEVWYARGTLRVGLTSIPVGEFSTGANSRADAEAFAEAEARKIVQNHLEGAAGRARRLTIDDCLLAYLKRPGGVESYDADRVADMAERIGARPVSEAGAAWTHWLETRGAAMAPSSAARWRSTLVAALHHGCAANGIPAPSIPTVHVPDDERVVWLPKATQDALLGAYNKHAGRAALALCYQGLRTQEALQARWSHIDFGRSTWFVPADRAKSGKARTVALHPRVRTMLELMDAERREREAKRREARVNAPLTDHVFLSARGEPYADTRGQGGNPLSQAHETACRAIGLLEPCPKGRRDPKTGEIVMTVWFTPHDFRHHWASWQVMMGTDLITLKRMGGWKDMRSVERYASVSAEHMAQAIARMP